MIPFSLT